MLRDRTGSPGTRSSEELVGECTDFMVYFCLEYSVLDKCPCTSFQGSM